MRHKDVATFQNAVASILFKNGISKSDQTQGYIEAILVDKIIAGAPV